jgi:hypothetical protein
LPGDLLDSCLSRYAAESPETGDGNIPHLGRLF